VAVGAVAPGAETSALDKRRPSSLKVSSSRVHLLGTSDEESAACVAASPAAERPTAATLTPTGETRCLCFSGEGEPRPEAVALETRKADDMATRYGLCSHRLFLFLSHTKEQRRRVDGGARYTLVLRWGVCSVLGVW